jgi:hypothetical protein
MKAHDITARTRQLGRLVAREGVSGAASRMAGRIERKLAGGSSEAVFLHLSDAVDPANRIEPAPAQPVTGRPLRIGWLSVPPSGGSGGHTTMFRMLAGLEALGHECVLYLYDVHDGDLATYQRTVRQYWPEVRATVKDVRDGLEPLDAWVATSWETAHVLAARPQVGGHRFYFVQDYEPYFYARSSQAVLAEDTYRFGFHGITAGRWLAGKLGQEFGMDCYPFEFGTDTKIYHREADAVRTGVVFYAKPDVPRRAYSLGILALAGFVEKHPGVPIHLFGHDVGRLPFPAVSHGRMSPSALNELYNTCRVGLSLSLTNVSLIPWELLAAGVIPVVNDAEHNRIVLQNDFVHWAPLSTSALSAALGDAYAAMSAPALSASAAASILETSWDDVAAGVARHIVDVVSS